MRGGSVPAMPAHVRFVLSLSKDGGRGWRCPPWFDRLTTNRGELVFPNDRPPTLSGPLSHKPAVLGQSKSGGL